MRIPSKVSYFVAGSATLALLAGCSGGGSGVATPSAGGGVTQQSVGRTVPGVRRSYSLARPGVQARVHSAIAVKPFVNLKAISQTANTIAVSDFENSFVDIFDSKGNLDATLAGGFLNPQGMTSDINGDLFIADTGNSRIVKYAAGFKGSPTSVSDPGQLPVDVDSFSNGKWLAVTNIFSSSDGPGSVTIYKQNKAIATVTSSSLAAAYFCAFDATGNLFVSGIDGNGEASVGEIPNATSGGTLTYKELTTSNFITFPGGVQVTTTGSIVVDDQSGGSQGGSVLYTYNPPVNGSLGAPTATTQLGGSIDVVQYAFTNDMSSLYGEDADNLDESQWSYPGGGNALSSFSVPDASLLIGTAVIPTQWPKVQP